MRAQTSLRLGLVFLIQSSLALSDPYCQDPFHNNVTHEYFQPNCKAGRKALGGLFPASHCIKLSGYFEDNGENMVVRSCSVDSGSLTADTELVRISHCGYFVYNGRGVKGCVQSCHLDGCNHASNHPHELSLIALVVFVILSSCLTFSWF